MNAYALTRALTGGIKPPKPVAARRVTRLKLGAISNLRDRMAARGRRWRRRHRQAYLAFEARRREKLRQQPGYREKEAARLREYRRR